MGASLAAPTRDAANASRPLRKTSVRLRQTRSSGSAPGAAPGICAASRSPRRRTARPAESRSGTAASDHSDASVPMRRCRNGCWALSPSRSRLVQTVGSAHRLAPTPRPKCCSAAHMPMEVSMESETRAPRARHNRRGARPRTGRCSFAARATWAARPAWARRCAALLRAARRARDQDRSTAEDWSSRVTHDGAWLRRHLSARIPGRHSRLPRAPTLPCRSEAGM